MAGIDKYDPALLGILQNEGEIAKFLDVIMGFLYRRTDFFLVMKKKTDKIGFPPGIAGKLLLTAYKRFEDQARKKEEGREREEKEEETRKAAKLTELSDLVAPPAVKTVEVESSVRLDSPMEVQEEIGKSIDEGNTTHKTDQTGKSPSEPQTSHTDNKGEDEEPKGNYNADSECYNGAVRENYSWSQTITDCDIRVKVPSCVRKGKDVKVIIKRKHIIVKYRTEISQWVEAMEGPLTWDVRADDSIWSLVPGEYIHINFEKVQERWWEAVLENEPKINVQKIDASRPFTDLDEESQAKLEEMMYNEQQKRLGLPTSNQKDVSEMLKKAWNAKGSPFQGQPFDPTKISVDPSGMVSVNK